MPSSTSDLTLGTVAVRAQRHTVCAAEVTVGTAVPTAITVTAESAGHRVTVAAAEPATGHTVALVGLRASTDYTVTAWTAEPDAHRIGRPVPLRTGELPSDLPRIRVTADRDRMAPGLTLCNLIPWHPATLRYRRALPLTMRDQPDLGYVVAVDDEGHIVWYYRTGMGIDDARQLPDGDFLVNCDDSVTRRIDVLGRTVREWATRVASDRIPTDELGRPRVRPDAVLIDTDSMHHDVVPMPSGTLLFLSSELREIVDPSGARCDGTTRYEVIGDVVVEADQDTGAILDQWRLLDVVDPLRRPGTHLCAGGLRHTPPINFYPDADYARDWSHGNSVVLDERRNALLLSARHLDAVFALRYRADDDGPAGALLWEFGPYGDVALADGEWPYHPHAVEVQPDGGILLYDNGTNRPGHSGVDGEPHPFSRAVLYDLDTTPGRRPVARQRWEHRTTHDRRPAFSRRLGDADRLPNGNVLITHGYLVSRFGNVSARVMEVVPDEPAGGDVVFDMTIDGTRSGWAVYRARRIPALHPTVVQVSTVSS